jgi:hypothetical protein
MGLLKKPDGQISGPDVALEPRNDNMELLWLLMGCPMNGSRAQKAHVIIEVHELHQFPNKPFRR